MIETLKKKEEERKKNIQLKFCFSLFVRRFDAIAFIFVEFVPSLRFQFESIIFFEAEERKKKRQELDNKLCNYPLC